MTKKNYRKPRYMKEPSRSVEGFGKPIATRLNLRSFGGASPAPNSRRNINITKFSTERVRNSGTFIMIIKAFCYVFVQRYNKSCIQATIHLGVERIKSDFATKIDIPS